MRRFLTSEGRRLLTVLSIFAAYFVCTSTMAAAEPGVSACPRILIIPSEMRAAEKRFIIVGETHGTDTSPEIFGDLVCELSRERDVIVHLEMPESLQDPLAAFIQGDGAIEPVLGHPMFSSDFYDGRGSAAFLELLFRLREMRREGHRITVNAAQPEVDLPPPQYYYEMAMALDWAKASAESDALNLVLVGSFHATLNNPDFQTAAMFLLRGEIVNLRVCREGGRAVVMNAEGETEFRQIASDQSALGRGIFKIGSSEQASSIQFPMGFDYVACAGRPSTASKKATN